MSLGLQPEHMTKDEALNLTDVLLQLTSCNLTDWEIEFVEDMLERLETYEERTIISDRQQQQIDEMEEKYL